MKPWVHLSKTISHALRHEPWVYELELDAEGWVPLASLIAALRETRRDFATVTIDPIREIMASADKQRFELDAVAQAAPAGAWENCGKIRALYGHSVPGKLARTAAPPPAVLYHGTAPDVAEIIRRDGLKPMSRQYVHLSIDRETALQVGQRKAGKPVLLAVAAEKAHQAGVKFYAGNEKVWLADSVPGEFIGLAE